MGTPGWGPRRGVLSHPRQAREAGGARAENPPEKATINENLKNIGKFFRRDIGGLGARFGKRDITPTGSGRRRRDEMPFLGMLC